MGRVTGPRTEETNRLGVGRSSDAAPDVWSKFMDYLGPPAGSESGSAESLPPPAPGADPMAEYLAGRCNATAGEFQTCLTPLLSAGGARGVCCGARRDQRGF